MATSQHHLLQTLRTIVSRFPERATTQYHTDILTRLDAWEAAEKRGDAAEFHEAWSDIKTAALTCPPFFYYIFRNLAERDARIFELIKRQHFERDVASRGPTYDINDAWLATQSDEREPGSMIATMLNCLATEDNRKGKRFELLSIYLTFVDLLHSHLVQPAIKPHQETIYRLLYLQSQNWQSSYCYGNAYQGFGRLSISGAKPTEARMQQYDIDSLLNREQRVLDIGSNMGFMSLYLAERCKMVDAVEYNPYLCQVGQNAANALGLNNVNFICSDFFLYVPESRYDVVFSLANHATIDQKLSMNFEDYIKKLFSLMNPGGHLFFESHNVFGSGTGGPGDDGDLDKKFDIAERYFDVVKYRMTKKFVPDYDMDKLFVVMKRKDHIEATMQRTIHRAEAISRYTY